MARKLKRSALVAYSAEQMFRLVNDIEAYPQFLPHCNGAKILTANDACVEAELQLGKGPVAHSFCTRNTLTPFKKIQLQLLTGPFKQFDGVWLFNDLASGCEVSFSLTFDFSSLLLNLTAGKWMEDIASEQVDVMCRRAKQVYG
ncbi:MAG: type II toxin-antitoxin system RatA family toxin [Marinagarivorans sp.]|nr:type II toxin-antitoxin system RatA family toxin [Marinagarivorans sp.]